MAGVNKAIVVGNLGQDPELRYTSNENPVANFSMATNRRWKDRETGEQQERTEWHRVVAWGTTGENAAKFLSKGRQVYVEGEIRTRSWKAKCDCGEEHDRFVTELHVGIPGTTIQFLGSGNGAGRPENQAGFQKPGEEGPEMPISIPEDEIPF